MEATYLIDSQDQKWRGASRPTKSCRDVAPQSVPQMQDNPYIFCGRKAGQHLVNLTDAWGEFALPRDSAICESMIYGARSVLGLSETAHRFIWSARCSITRIKKLPPAMRIFRPRSGTKRSTNMAGMSSTSDLGRQQHQQTRRTDHPHPRPLFLPVAGHFTPLRETRCISSSGRSPREPYQNGLAYRMWVLRRSVDGQVSRLPIEDTGRESALGKNAKRLH